MLQLQVIDDFGDSSLPISKSRSAMYLSSSLAVYEMKNEKDKSGNGMTLQLNGLSFDSEGLVCDSVDGHYADTGIVEPMANTVIVAFRADPQTFTTQIYSSLLEGVSPFRGSRSAITKDGFFVSDVGAIPTIHAQTGNVTPGWEMMAVVTGAKQLTVTRASTMGTVKTAFEARREPVNTTRIGGGYVAPHNLGITGRVGLWAMYNGALDDATIKDLFAKARTIMAAKGVIVP
ncbi:hypothetical protein YA25_00240 [Klebsiella aerogenes]|uniref:hypothetical protein n=1 Tax=Klebsiella aerogenes TaxID=548 RepID=UPI00063C6212|nr:hypothetical protein [Klebsiella aerogenes]KLF10426.1 hypothetical protein YA25_00240 [Klebsiella aerogenes]